MAATNLPTGFAGGALAAAQTGLAFADLIRKTGEAVAETQKQLNKNSAAAASALANTTIDIVAVEEKVYNDSGVLSHSNAHVLPMPLAAFVEPAFYRWSEVRVQGQFVANEFAAESSSTTTVDTSQQNFGIRLGGFVGLGSSVGGSSANTNASTGVTSDVTQDQAYGLIRANAELVPRPDITVPRPRQVIQGPRLSVFPGETQDIIDPVSRKVVGRTLSVLVSYNRADGQPIAGKTLSIDTAGVSWRFYDQAKKVTGDNGQLEIVLRRDFALDAQGNPQDTTPKEFVVTARIGIVQNSTTVRL